MIPSLQTLLSLYRKIFLIRECENCIRREYAADEMKTPVHLGVGGEAIQAGVLEAAGAGVSVFGSYRNHGIYLALTEDTDGFFAELYGKVTGSAGGKAGSMHLTYPEKGLMLTSAVVGTTIPVAVGSAFANAYRNRPAWTLVFFGDGAMEEGAFWESLNFACLHHLRILFVCEDNGLAIHTLTAQRKGFKSVPDVIRPFECLLTEAEGHKADHIFNATRDLLSRMDTEKKPGFLYAPYHRFLEHVGVNEDYAFQYRAKPDPATLQALDPLEYLQALLGKTAGCGRNQLELISDSIKKQIEASVAKAKAAPFPVKEMLREGVR